MDRWTSPPGSSSCSSCSCDIEDKFCPGADPVRRVGYDFDPGSNVVDVNVRSLRRKLGAQRFETVRGMGYRLP